MAYTDLVRLLQIWLAWSLAFFFCIAAPAQAMSASKALANPLATKLDTHYFPINHTDPDGLEALTYGQRGTTNAPSYNINNLPGNAQNAALAGAIVGLALETAPTAGLAIEYIGIRAGVSVISRAGASIYVGSQAVGRALSGGYVTPRTTVGLPNDNHHKNQIGLMPGGRGWTQESMDDTVVNFKRVGDTINSSTGNPATAYFRADGHYVVRDNITGKFVQGSNMYYTVGTGPNDWKVHKDIVMRR